MSIVDREQGVTVTVPLLPDSVIEIVPTFRFQWEEVQQAYVLLYPEGMVKLNQSAGEILKRCDGQRTLSGILADLQIQFPGADLDGDVREFIEVAREQGWIRIG